MDYELVPYAPQYRGQVVELQRQLWSPSPDVNAAYFRWKYEENPYVLEPIAALAFHGDRLVAMRGFFGAGWEEVCGGPRHIVPCAGDTVIHSDHRRPNLALFERLNRVGFDQMAARGFPYVFNLSASRGVHLASLRTHWKGLEPYALMTRRLGLSRVHSRAGRLVRRLGTTPLVAASVRWIGGLISGRRVDQATQSLEPRPDRMADLIRRLPADGRIRHQRDETFFSWRFENPLSTYRFFFWEDTDLEGYLILQQSRFGGDRAFRIVDWEATSERVRQGLLMAALRWIASGEVSAWSVTLPPGTLRLLDELGFIAVPDYRATRRYRQAVLLNRTSRDEANGRWQLGGVPLLDTASWDLRMIYSDAY